MTYDNSAVEMLAGGYGFAETATDHHAITSSGYTATDYGDGAASASMDAAGCTARVSGTLKRFKARFFVGTHNIPATAGSCVIKVMKSADNLSPNALANTNAADSTVDITAEVRAAAQTVIDGGGNGYFTVDLDLAAVAAAPASPIVVAAGNFFGLWISGASSADLNLAYRTNNPGDTTGKHARKVASDAVTSWSNAVANSAWLWEFTVMSTDRVRTVSATPYYNRRYRVAAPTDRPFYLHFSEVVVQDDKKANIAFEYVDASTGATTAEKALELNFVTADTNYNGFVSLDAFTTKKSVQNQESDKFDIHVWIDPVNNLIDAWAINLTGKNGACGGPGDIRHMSVTGRCPQVLTDGNILKSILFASSSTVTCAGVYWSREPIIALGDSFCGSFDTANRKALLARIGARLDNAAADAGFTQQRYVIKAGISSDHWGDDDPNFLLTAIGRRWRTDAPMLHVKAWNGATAYTGSDIVLNDGVFYHCISNHTNQEPPNATYWEIAARHNPGDRVQYQGQIWTCISATAGEVPAEGLLWTATAPTDDLCSYRNAVYVIVDPGLNDILHVRSSYQGYQVAGRVAGVLGKIVGEIVTSNSPNAYASDTIYAAGDLAMYGGQIWMSVYYGNNTNHTPEEGIYWTRWGIGGRNDVVVCNLIRQTSLTAIQQATIARLNTLIRFIASEANIPLANVAEYSFGYSGSVHPSTTTDPVAAADPNNGEYWVSSKIVAAYEQNSVPARLEEIQGIFGRIPKGYRIEEEYQ